MTNTLHGTLRRTSPTSRHYTGELIIGPARYVVDGVAMDKNTIQCQFRVTSRFGASVADFVREGRVWVCRVTLENFPWVLTGTPTDGVLVVEGVGAPKEDLVEAGILPF
jgi:hypothetical protein